MSYLNHPEMNNDHCQRVFFQSLWFSVSHCSANMFFFLISYVAKISGITFTSVSIYLPISIYFNGE